MDRGLVALLQALPGEVRVVGELQRDLGESPQLGDRGPQLVGDVRGGAALAVEGRLEGVETLVQGIHDGYELAGRAA